MRAYITTFPDEGLSGLRLEIKPMDKYVTIRIGYEGDMALPDSITFFADNERLAHTYQAFMAAADEIAKLLRDGSPDSDIEPAPSGGEGSVPIHNPLPKQEETA